MRTYTGIGSRQTPPEVCTVMTSLAIFLSFRGWVLRSGGAEGADASFEAGGNDKEIYLPWPKFNGNQSRLCRVTEEAIQKSLTFHPTPHKLSDAVRKIMGRNLYQIVGWDLASPSKFVVCWTPFPTEDAWDSSLGVGGTGQALRIAHHYNVPIYNLRDTNAIDKLKEDLPCLES